MKGDKRWNRLERGREGESGCDLGSEYGLKVYSEPDEGTKVVIHIPAIPYTEENRERLERQDFGRGMVTDEEE